MRPDKVKHLLEQHGEVTRLYLAPEDESVARRRRKLGGQRATNYTEGWVEYADKKVAKAVARSLNGTKIGGRKRGYYSEDMWTLKYLRHFTWSHLTEKKAYERRVAQGQAAAGDGHHQAGQRRVPRARGPGKMLRSIEERKTKKAKQQVGGGGGGGGGSSSSSNGGGGGEGRGVEGGKKAAGKARGFDEGKVRRSHFQHAHRYGWGFVARQRRRGGVGGEQKRRGEGLAATDLQRALGQRKKKVKKINSR